MKSFDIEYNNSIIRVDFIYKPKNRNIYFKFKSNILTISCPRNYNLIQIKELLSMNKNILDKIIKKTENTNTIHYLGNEYEIEIIQSDSYNVYLTESKLIVETKINDDVVIEKLIHSFYTFTMKEYTNRVFDSIFEKFNDLKMKKPKLIFKYTTSFYGKCFITDKKVVLSGICMKYNPKYIDSVIYHELSHFAYTGHQKDFYDYYENHLPGAKQIQKELKSIKYNDKY